MTLLFAAWYLHEAYPRFTIMQWLAALLFSLFDH